MKKRLLKMIAATCSLAVIATAGAGVATLVGNNNKTANAYEITLEEGNALEAEYAFGTSISIPMGEIDGARTNKFVAISPSGKVYNSETLSLLEMGQYTIIWYANVGGREVSAEKSFLVTQSSFSVSGGVEYAYVDSLSKAPKADLDGDEQEGASGVKVSIEPESSIRYNKAIDLNDSSIPFAHIFPYHGISNIEDVTDSVTEGKTLVSNAEKALAEVEKQIEAEKETIAPILLALEEVEEKLENAESEEEIAALEAEKAELLAQYEELRPAYEAKIAELEAERTKRAKALSEAELDLSQRKLGYQYYDDARNYYITLTDCFDPTNYVTIDLEWQEDRTYWNFRAGATNQTAHGLRSKITDPSLGVEIDGKSYQYHMAPGQGLTSCNVIDDYGLKLYYDTQTNCVYITFCRYTTESGYTVNNRVLLADLDNETIYPKNAFKGFTTGEVYLSISAKNHLDSTANVEIFSLGGVSGSALMEIQKDTVAPVIHVDKALSEKNIIALNEEVNVPDALVLDLSLPANAKATAAVYYAYNPNSTNNAMIGVKNGKFTPTKTGRYTIVYTAVDASGNTSTETVDLQCVSAENNTAVKLTVLESLDAYAGESLAIPVCSIEGLYTDADSLKIYVSIDGGDSVLVKGDTLFLDGVAKYVLTYVYETPFKTYTATCTVTAAASDKVSIDAPILPEYFINNATYTLDTVYAHEYTAKQPVSVPAKAYMKADDGEYVEINTKEVKIIANETVQFKYEHGNETRYSEVIKVVDVGFGGDLSMKEYFHCEDNAFESTATSSGVKYISNGTAKEGKATLKYINVLSLSSFKMEFTIPTAEKNSDVTYAAPTAVTFTLVDYYDRDNFVTIRFANQSGNKTQYSVNGQEVATFDKAFTDTKITVSYNKGFLCNGVRYAWEGAFTGDKMLMWMTVEGMNGNACVNVSKICDRNFNSTKSDKAEPVLYFEKSNTGYQAFGKVITISQALASDILAPYVESGLKLTATNPDGTYARSVDGVLLDGTCPVDREYQLELNKVGTYTVIYEYTDQNGKSCARRYSPIVRDQTAPVLIVDNMSENEVTKAVWGDTVRVASYSVSDDMSPANAIESWICVFYPSGIARDLGKGGTFYAEEKGTYTVLYYAYDEMGNYSTFAYVVEVS